ncbi:hypothetical protein MRX96_030706 [Rhipicephalus microplus]
MLMRCGCKFARTRVITDPCPPSPIMEDDGHKRTRKLFGVVPKAANAANDGLTGRTAVHSPAHMVISSASERNTHSAKENTGARWERRNLHVVLSACLSSRRGNPVARKAHTAEWSCLTKFMPREHGDVRCTRPKQPWMTTRVHLDMVLRVPFAKLRQSS